MDYWLQFLEGFHCGLPVRIDGVYQYPIVSQKLAEAVPQLLAPVSQTI
jgi:hypothetical protein